MGSPACRAHARTALSRLPFEFAAVDDPYAAAVELSRRPLAYRAVVLCLNSIFREELGVISLVKQHFRHVDVYLSQTDGRHAAIVDATRRGADGILGDDGLHRFDGPAVRDLPRAVPASEPVERIEPAEPPAADRIEENEISAEEMNGEAVLTAEELRALLQEQPSLPPGSDS